MKKYDELFFGSFCEILLDCYEKFSGSSKDKRSGKIEFGKRLLLCGTSNSFQEDIEYASIDDCVSDKMMSGYLNNRPVTATIISQYFNDGYDPRTTLSEKAGRKYFKDEIVPYIQEKQHALYNNLIRLIYRDNNIPIQQKELFKKMPFKTEKEKAEFLYAVFFYSIRVTDAKAFRKKINNLSSSDEASLSKVFPGNYGIYNTPFDDIEDFDRTYDDWKKHQRTFYSNLNKVLLGFRQEFIQILYGTDGTGKSTIAYAFLRERSTTEKRTAIWIDATDEAAIICSIRTFLLESHLCTYAASSTEVSDNDIKKLFMDWLTIGDPWTIVFDDATCAYGKWTYSDYLPKPKGNCDILITTAQSPDVRYQSIEMQLLEPEEVAEIYSRLLGKKFYLTSSSDGNDYILDKTDSGSIVPDLAGIPLAVNIAPLFAKSVGDLDLSSFSKYRNISDKLSYQRLSSEICREVYESLFFDCSDAAYFANKPFYFEYLKYLAILPRMEIYADTIYDIFFVEEKRELFDIPEELDFVIRDHKRFSEMISNLVNSGFVSVSHYCEEDERYIKELDGIKWIKMHRCFCDYFLEDHFIGDGRPNMIFSSEIDPTTKRRLIWLVNNRFA